MNINLSDALPWIAGGVGALIIYHALMSRRTEPQLAMTGNTPDFPDFPKLGIDNPYGLGPGDSQFQWVHPYNHPIIPRYVGQGSHFQNSVPLDESHFRDGIWYDQQIPPLHVKVSTNLPEPNVYSHHKMFFDERGPEQMPLERGVLTNIV